MRRHVAPILAALVLALSPVIAPAQTAPDQPLLIEGTQTVFQRVLTRPGAPLSPAPGAVPDARLPAFQPLYVYARDTSAGGGDWLQVGPSTRAATGWVPEAATVDWRQNIVASFTNAAGRQRQLFYDSADRLRAVMGSEGVLALEAALVDRADNGALRPDDGVVAAEPQEFVSILDNLYLMPILDFAEDLHPLTYDATLLMQLASVPMADGAEPVALAGADPDGDFDAGIVFVLDTTRSMGPYIERTQRALSRIVADLRGTEAGERLNFGVVGFRDNVDAVPDLEYRTRVLIPLDRRADQTPVLQTILEATEVATVSSPGFNEDSLAGVQDALDLMDWDGADIGGGRFDGRYVILVTDAGPKDPGDPNARSPVGPAEVAREAADKGIVIFTLHLMTDEGGPAQHAYAADRYRALSRYGELQFYFPIEGGQQDAFEATVTRLVTALTDHVRAARGQATVLAEDEIGPDLAELGLAVRLAYLGTRAGTQAPDVIEGWVSDRAVSDPARLAFEPRLLVTKNELATMAEYLDQLVTLGEAARGAEDASGFFADLQGVMARMAQNPDRLVNANADTLGGALEFLDRLPYRSQIMDMTPDRWAQSAMERRVILDSLRQKLSQYRRWLFDPAVWTPLYDGAPDGEHVFAMPFDILP